MDETKSRLVVGLTSEADGIFPHDASAQNNLTVMKGNHIGGCRVPEKLGMNLPDPPITKNRNLDSRERSQGSVRLCGRCTTSGIGG